MNVPSQIVTHIIRNQRTGEYTAYSECYIGTTRHKLGEVKAKRRKTLMKRIVQVIGNTENEAYNQ